MRQWRYHFCCVDLTTADTDAIGVMVGEARGITRVTFLGYVNRPDMYGLQKKLGYEWHWQYGLTMAADHHVNYYRSRLWGRPCVYFDHSAIEYIFLAPEEEGGDVSSPPPKRTET